jgi:hypothetical protein
VTNPFDNGDDDRYLGRRINRDLSHLMKLYSKKSLKDKEDDEDKEEATKPPASTRASSRPDGAGDRDDDGCGADPDRPGDVVRSRDLNELIEGLTAGLKKRLDQIKQELREEMASMIGQVVGKLLATELAGQLEARLSNITREQRQRGDELFDQVRQLIGSNRPEVHVTVPPEVIKVLLPQQDPPQVFVPPDAIKINVENRTLLQPTTPRKTVVRKSIIYGATGRPERIEEESEEK